MDSSHLVILYREKRKAYILSIGCPIHRDCSLMLRSTNLEDYIQCLLWKHKEGNTIINTVYSLGAKECIYKSSVGVVGRLRDFD